jgi:hypothetical protein
MEQIPALRILKSVAMGVLTVAVIVAMERVLEIIAAEFPYGPF